MKRITLFAAVATVIVVLSSCQKETASNSPLPTQSIKIKTYTEDVRSSIWGTSVTTYNLSYDSDDRLVSGVDANNSGNKIVYGYPSSTKYTVDIYDNNVLQIHGDYFLNSLSLIDSAFQYNNTADSSTEKYVYNAAHQVIKWYQYDYSKVTGSDLWNVTTYTYDGAGNMIKADDGQTVITYEYYTDKLYVSPQTVPVFVPLEKANLLKKVTITDGIDVGTGTYTYTFDSKDRISTQREDYSNGDVVIKTYTYFD